MMRKLLSIFFLLVTTIAVQAENYPYRNDFLWVTNPDHADWLYKTGDTPKVEVQLYKYGYPVNAEVSYEIGPDMLPAISKGKVQLKNGRVTIPMISRKDPGFMDLRLTAIVDGMKTTHHVKVGFDVEKIKPFTKMPKDFTGFWQETLKDYEHPQVISRELFKEYCTDKIDCWLVKLKTDKSHYIYGYLTMPKDSSKGRFPAVLCPPGAGVKTIKEPLRHKYYAENGFIRFEVEIHGLNPTFTEDQFAEIRSGLGDYLKYGIESKEHYYMRHVYGSMVAAMKYLESLPEWNHKDLAVQGGSQGGALSFVTAALMPDEVTLCVANHPALTDMAGYSEKGRTGGYPHFKQDFLTTETINTLAYYDVINFCRLIKCPVRLTFGYNDVTCPPTTSYAAWNSLTCPKELFLTPINEHWTSETMERQHMEWIQNKLTK